MKKTLYFSILIFIILFFIVLYNNLKVTYYEGGEVENSFNKNLKQILPQNVKNFAKDTIFVFKKVDLLEKKQLDILKEYNNFRESADEKIGELEKRNEVLNEIIDKQSNQIYEIQTTNKKLNKFVFHKNLILNKQLGQTKLLFKSYSLPFLKELGPRSYFGYDDKNLYLITGTGLLMYNSLENLEKEKMVFSKIKTNFNEIVDKKHNETKHVVKNILIKKDKIYLSYVKKIKENCYSNVILISKLNTEELYFNEFFNTNECQSVFNEQSGGALSNYKDNKILMTLGDYGSYENPAQGNDNPQNINRLIGKIISISDNGKNYEILSMGHRNPQGLFYDTENDVIYNAEHGPMGGDEININKSPDGGLKNYGWGVSSYGEHYGYPSDDHVTKKKYELAPLHKSHSKFGFEEPLKYFVPSIGPSQIIKNNEFIKMKDKNIIYLAAMGRKIDEGDLSVHQFILNEKLEIDEHNILRIYERVRDIVYLEKLNKIFLFLETSGSIAFLERID